jgi:hypothetical protein
VPDTQTYEFPARQTSGVIFGLSVARASTIAGAAVVFIITMVSPTPTGMAAGSVMIAVLLVAATIRIAGRTPVDWLPVVAAHAWQMATRRNEFYASPDLALDLPEGVLDLPGELFGIEILSFATRATATIDNATAAPYGLVRDTFRNRMLAIAEVSAADFLFADPSDQQARLTAWGRLLDHVAQSLPDLVRLQVLHSVAPRSSPSLDRHRDDREAPSTSSYRDVIRTARELSQQHRSLIVIGLDLGRARRAIRQAGGGTDGAAQVLMDRAATLEDALVAAGIEVHGWLPARKVASVLKAAFDPAATRDLDAPTQDVNEGGGTDPVAAGPTGMTDTWTAVRHDSGWSATLQVIRPPTRPVTGDFLQHLLIGVAARRRLSILYVPTPMAEAERRAQTQQVSTESEQQLRTRWGFGSSARQRRIWQDAAQREEELVEGRAVFKIVWLVTVTAESPSELEVSVGQVEAAARRCALEVRRLNGTQRQAFGFTLPLCRGAR